MTEYLWWHHKQDPNATMHSCPSILFLWFLRGSPRVTANHKCYATGHIPGKEVKKAGSGIQCHKKNVVERQIQYRHFCYLVLKKTNGKGQDTEQSRSCAFRIESTTLPCLHCYERGKPSSPKLGTPKYLTLILFAGHQVFNSKEEEVVKVCCLSTTSKPLSSK